MIEIKAARWEDCGQVAALIEQLFIGRICPIPKLIIEPRGSMGFWQDF